VVIPIPYAQCFIEVTMSDKVMPTYTRKKSFASKEVELFISLTNHGLMRIFLVKLMFMAPI
jgi:hypothetical protein